MSDNTNAPVPSTDTGKNAAHVSRRSLLHGATIAVGGMAIAMCRILPAVALMPQKAAHYQDKPKGPAKCSGCTHFEPPHACGIVAGNISPNGWCQFYVKK
ncbi:MAG: twin-arginine translocation signal domain-containing protein [Rhizomicrobium sp.]